jgi:hypothetical protein
MNDKDWNLKSSINTKCSCLSSSSQWIELGSITFAKGKQARPIKLQCRSLVYKEG